MPNAIEDYQGELPDGWTGGQALTKWWRGALVHLYTLKKPCAECKGEMRIDVTKAALEGRAKNAGLHLKRCATCRARSRALNTSSRPHVEGEVKNPFVATPAVEGSELDQLRTANATMKEELDGLYAQNRELRQRLEKYELAPAMAAVAAGRMPWEH